MRGHNQCVRIDLASQAFGRNCRSLMRALANIRLSVIAIAIAKMRASGMNDALPMEGPQQSLF